MYLRYEKLLKVTDHFRFTLPYVPFNSDIPNSMIFTMCLQKRGSIAWPSSESGFFGGCNITGKEQGGATTLRKNHDLANIYTLNYVVAATQISFSPCGHR